MNPATPIAAARAVALAGVVLLAATMAGPARADVSPFQTPSGNIQCVIAEDFGVPPEVSCTIVQRQGPPAAPALAACGAGQEHGFSLRETGPVTVGCAAASGANPGAEVAAYGVSAQWGALGCTSSRQGFECRNGAGHGFFLSRASQRVW